MLEVTPSPRTIGSTQWWWILLGLGVLLRLVRLLLQFPLWGDEYLLAENFLPPDWSLVTRPLKNGQVAPLGFLLQEIATVRWLGFTELSLRIGPFVSSLLALFLFASLTRLLQSAWEATLSVGFLAATFYAVRYSAEVKPYAGDQFWSVLLILIACTWWRTRKTLWLMLWLVVTPLAVLSSFPAVFVAGGVALGLMWDVWKRATFREQIGFLAIQFVLGLTFVLLQLLWLGPQFRAHAGMMTDYWKEGFPPPVSSFGRLLAWLVETGSSVLFAAPIGGEHSGSLLTALCFFVGWRAWWRRGDVVPCLMCLGTVLLAFIAAAMQRYPLGGHARLVQYFLPWVCLFAGTGAVQGLEALRTWYGSPDLDRWPTRLCGLLMLLGLGIVIHDVSRPFQRRVDADHRGFARWFWNSAPQRKLICLVEEFPQPMNVGDYWSPYRCYQAIYRRQGRPPLAPRNFRSIDEFPREPIRCVGFHLAGFERPQSDVDAFLHAMDTRFRLVQSQTLPVDLSAPPMGRLGYYDVWDFDPR